MNKNNPMRNETGISLLETMVAAGLMSTIAIGVTTIFSSQKKESRRMAQKMAINSLKSSLIAATQDQSTCAANLDESRDASLTFNSLEPNQKLLLSQFKNGAAIDATLLARTGQQIEAGLIIDEISLTDLNDTGSGNYSGRWRINFKNTNESERTHSPIIIGPQIFTVDAANPSATKITACETFLSGDLPWLLGGNDLKLNPISFIGINTNIIIPGKELIFRRNGVIATKINTQNTSYGTNALTTSGSIENTALGVSALSVNTGSRNVAAGWEALSSNTSGNDNTAVGAEALRRNTTGSSNSALGFQSLAYNTTGSNNTALGSQSQANTTTGNQNTSAGAFSLNKITTGSQNIAIGVESQFNAAITSQNISVGDYSLREMTSGSSTRNITIGNSNLRFDRNPQGNVALGYESQKGDPTSNSTISNTSAGRFSLGSNLAGDYNSALGSYSLSAPLIGTCTTAAGAYALNHLTDSLGMTAVGYQALASAVQGFSTAAGSQALYSSIANSYNIAIGYRALYTNQSGIDNIAVGNRADTSLNNISNAIAIGAGAIVDANNKVRLGNASVNIVESQVPFSTPSDEALKTNVKDYPHGLNLILKLHPITFTYKNDPDQKMQLGLIAQEVAKTKIPFPGLYKPPYIKGFYSLAYSQLVIPLVNSIKELHEKILGSQKEKAKLDEKLISLEKRVHEYKNRLSKINSALEFHRATSPQEFSK